jgi:ClpP class serine protease
MKVFAGLRDAYDDYTALAKSGGASSQAAQQSLVIDGVAHIFLCGLIYEDAPDCVGGIVRPSDVQAEVMAAITNPLVSSIAMHFKSPGGFVDGVPALADTVYLASALKPIKAYADGTCASAAYWIASQCQSIECSPESRIGGVGAFAVLHDTSAAAEAQGIKVIVVASGSAKGGADGAPISQETLIETQEYIAETMSLFKAAVERARGAQAAQIYTGRTWVGRAALAAGLIDGITGGLEMAENEKKPIEDEEVTPTDAPAEEAPAPEEEAPAEPTKEEKKLAEEEAAKKKLADEMAAKAVVATASMADVVAQLRAQVNILSKERDAARAQAAMVQAKARMDSAVASGKLTPSQLKKDGKDSALAKLALQDPNAFDEIVASMPSVQLQTVARSQEGIIEPAYSTHDEKIYAMATKLAKEKGLTYGQVAAEAIRIVNADEAARC